MLVAGFLLIAGSILSESDLGLGVFAIPLIGVFVALGVAAYIPFGILNRRLSRPLPLGLCALALVGLSAFWIWGFGSTFWWNDRPDAQDGLVILVLPVYMMAASGFVAVAIWAIDRYL